jgi:Tfp pilus assembly protein PilV
MVLRRQQLEGTELKLMRRTNQIRTLKSQDGFMLLELLIAMIVLTVGLGGLLVLMVSAIYGDTRSSNDSSATMVAEHVLEQITAQSASSTTSLTLTDCAANSWTISTQGYPVGATGTATNGGYGANLTSAGQIDWTESYSSVPSGYAMQYVACGTGGKQVTYDVRWNVMWLNGYSTASYTQSTVYSQLVVISARPAYANQSGGLRFTIPAQLQTVQGM